jgi:hypothetical protein
VRSCQRFRSAFAASYEQIAADGPIAAMSAAAGMTGPGGEL